MENTNKDESLYEQLPPIRLGKGCCEIVDIIIKSVNLNENQKMFLVIKDYTTSTVGELIFKIPLGLGENAAVFPSKFTSLLGLKRKYQYDIAIFDDTNENEERIRLCAPSEIIVEKTVSGLESPEEGTNEQQQ